MADRTVYRIGGQTFSQQTLVLGQVEHLLPLLEGVTFETTGAAALAAVLGPRLYGALACVLVPEGQTPADVVQRLDQGKRDELAAWLRGALTWDQAVTVVADFFDCNPVSLLPGLMGHLHRALRAALPTSNRIMPSSPQATSDSVGSSGTA